MFFARKPGLWAGGAIGFCLLSSLAFSQNAVEQRWPSATDSTDWLLAYAKPAQTPDPFSGLTFKPPATGLSAESGVNYSLSPYSGYLNLGSGTGNQAAGGTSGSVAFPIGHSFGLFTEGNAGSIGGYGIYDVGSNLYWRDPSLGLIGATGSVGHFNSSFSSANFASGGANFESYLDRFTPFATAGAFGVQSLKTRGYGTIGTAYYPTDNLQLSLSGYDYGGLSGVQGGAEYLLPQRVNGVATTISANALIGNHGTSGAMARLRFMFGPTPANNKTLIERRRQDDPVEDITGGQENIIAFAASHTPSSANPTLNAQGVPINACLQNRNYANENQCTCSSPYQWSQVGLNEYECG